ncbi:MAG: sigma-70 family RNA polymerase sigma factor [Planctomycetota bacterium]
MESAGEPVCWSDREAVAAYVEAQRPRLLAFIASRMAAGLRQRLDPDDIVQEVSLAAVRPAGADGGPPRDPFGWLCHVAEQRIIDAHRRHFGAAKRDAGREVSIDAPLPGADGDDAGRLASLLAVSMTTPSQVLSRDAREYRLAQAIEALPEEQRIAIRMRYVDGLATKVIAERMGKSDVAVRVMLSRTVQKLQQVVAE